MRTRWVVSVLAILGTVPYLTLKTLWLSGSRVGLLDPEFGHSAAMYAANAITLVMDGVAVVMALAFVTAWGRRIPGWLVLLPMWVGTGLLAPILVVVPLQAALAPFTAAAREAQPANPLADWVYLVVYGGFMWQGVFLLTGFVLYAADRWGRPLAWRQPVGQWPATGMPTLVPVAIGLAALAALAHTASSVPHLPVGTANLIGDLAMLACGAAGLAVLATRRPAGLPRWRAIVLTWLGSGAVAGWGLFHLVLLTVPNDLVGDDAVSGLDITAQALRLAAGLATALAALALARTWPREQVRSRTPDPRPLGHDASSAGSR